MSFTLNVIDQHAVAVIVLNDQGGAQMSVSYDRTGTLRAQMKHHEPIVLEAYGFKGGQSTGGIGFEKEVSPTLSNQPSALEPTVLIYDARGNGGGGVAPSLTGDHQDRVTDYTAIVVEHEDADGKTIL